VGITSCLQDMKNKGVAIAIKASDLKVFI
jgi:hypothetical protein